MNDPQIRHILSKEKLSKFTSDPECKIVHELVLPVAGARIDIAVINGSLHGYEIKSASDNLSRVHGQLVAYSKVFDYLTFVTEDKHLHKIESVVPDWVGISVCLSNGRVLCKRESQLNIDKDPFFIAQLLWKNELIDILTLEGIKFKRSSRVWILCEIAAELIPVERLGKMVRKKLKERINWKEQQESKVSL